MFVSSNQYMNKISPAAFYSQAIQEHTQELSDAKRRFRTFSVLRLVAFLAIAGGSWWIGLNWWLALYLVVGIALFLWLVNRSLDAKEDRNREELYLELNRKELNALKGDWSGFPDGAGYRNAKHPFSADMDVFGQKSIFQLMNRTVLRAGSDQLAQTLAYGAENIELNKAAIDDLSNNPEWMQQFIVEAQLRVKEVEEQSLAQIAKPMTYPVELNWLRWVLPILFLSAAVAYALSFIGPQPLIFVGLAVLGIVGRYLKTTNKVVMTVLNQSTVIEAMIAQLQRVNEVKASNDNTQEYLRQLMDKDGPYEALKELNALSKRMEYRMNLLVGTSLNVLLAWDFQLVTGFGRWSDKYASKLASWEQQVAQLEVWVSGGVYRFNHPGSIFATISSEESFRFTNLGHPFVAAEKQVKNDFILTKAEHFHIITGPNMAGKSTFLRSVGLAILSANAGVPVLADHCELPQVKLYSSMRTSDDLTVESSYFHAELSRLRFIMDAIERGEPTFIILDEILKGTNSKDKEIGSARFLGKLKQLGARGIIATHDLSLTNLSENTEAFNNWYFDSTIEGDELSFDYKIRPGVCQNMNASFLLRKMNLVDE